MADILPLQWVCRWWVPTGGRYLAQEPVLLAVDLISKQDDLVALAIGVVYSQHDTPVVWHVLGAQEKGPGLNNSASYRACWPRPDHHGAGSCAL